MIPLTEFRRTRASETGPCQLVGLRSASCVRRYAPVTPGISQVRGLRGTSPAVGAAARAGGPVGNALASSQAVVLPEVDAPAFVDRLSRSVGRIGLVLRLGGLLKELESLVESIECDDRTSVGGAVSAPPTAYTAVSRLAE